MYLDATYKTKISKRTNNSVTLIREVQEFYKNNMSKIKYGREILKDFTVSKGLEHDVASLQLYLKFTANKP